MCKYAHLLTCSYSTLYTLTAMRVFRGVDNVEDDINEILLEQEQQDLEPKWTFKELLSSKQLRLPLLLVASLASAQQLSGINVVSILPVY